MLDQTSHAERKASLTGQRLMGLSEFLLQHFQAHLLSQPCPEGPDSGAWLRHLYLVPLRAAL